MIDNKKSHISASATVCNSGTYETSPMDFLSQPCGPLKTPTNTAIIRYLDPSTPSPVPDSMPDNQSKFYLTVYVTK